MIDWHSTLADLGVVASLLLAVALAPSVAGAQDAVPLGYVSSNPVIIAGQISTALQFERRALELLAGASDNGQSIDAIRNLVYDSYVLVRFAVSGVRKAQGRRSFVDPLLQMQDDLMEEARAALRDCITELGRIRVDGSRDAAEATDNLTKAISRLETLEALIQ